MNSASHPIRVLCMEDDAAQANLVRKALTRCGYEVDLACDGNEGLRRLTAERYDVVLVDQTMPGRDGLEVIRAMSSEPTRPPIIMVTGTGDEKIAVEAMKLGVSDYVIKGMVGGFVHYLPTVIERALEKQHLAREKVLAQEQMAMFRRLAEASGHGVGMTDLEGRITYVNPALCRLVGEHQPQAMLGKNALQYYPTHLRQKLQEEILPQVRQGGQWVGELALLTTAGKVTPILENVFLIRDGDGRPLCLGNVLTDISERKRMEEELARAQKLEAVGQLAAGIAHEINTPTQYIGDNTRFLQDAFGDMERLLDSFEHLLEAADGKELSPSLVAEVHDAVRRADVAYLTDEIPRAIEQSLEGVDRVTTIVRAMKEFSHPGSKQKQPVDLNRAIENTITVSRNEWKYVADLVTKFDPDLPQVPAYLGSLNQAVLNVVVNAAQAVAEVVGDGAGAKGTITVSTRRDGEYAEIRVQDTGCGISVDIRSKVFDPFFTTKQVGKGTGQGLSIVHAVVVKDHGGTVSFETQTGKGTTFIIRLPLCGADQTESEARTEQPREERGRSRSAGSPSGSGHEDQGLPSGADLLW